LHAGGANEKALARGNRMITADSGAHKCHRRRGIGTGVLWRCRFWLASGFVPVSGIRDPTQCGNNIPNARQISALPVAMKKSSVPLGEKSSMSVLAIAMTTATPIHAGAKP